MEALPLSDLDPNRVLNGTSAAWKVPRNVLDGDAYVLLDEVDVDSIPGLIVFARCGLGGSLAVVVQSGIVVDLNPSGGVRFVSPTCDEFRLVASTISNASLGHNGRISEKVGVLREALVEEFPLSFSDIDGYWSTLLDDIEIGDFDEDVFE